MSLQIEFTGSQNLFDQNALPDDLEVQNQQLLDGRGEFQEEADASLGCFSSLSPLDGDIADRRWCVRREQRGNIWTVCSIDDG